MSRLDDALAEARGAPPPWSDARARGVLESALRARGLRVRRRRTIRRVAAVASGAGLVLALFVRTATLPRASADTSEPSAAAADTSTVAARALDDGGFARD